MKSDVKKIAILFCVGMLSLTLGACRLGNKIEEAKTVSPYSPLQMQAYQLVLCTLLQGETTGTCAESNLNEVTEWQSYLTNPILFYQQDKNSAEAYLISRDIKKSLPILLDSPSAKTFYHYSYTSPVAFFHHTACVTQMINYGEGTVNLQSGLPPAFGFQLEGTMDLVMQTEHVISGNCTQSLTEAHACYNDVNACGMGNSADNQREQDYVRNFFKPYILRGLMDVSDIPNISEVYYQLSHH